MKHLIALLAGCLISAPLCAYERNGNVVTLTPGEAEICDQDDHGCSLAPNSMFINDLKQAYQLGLHECRNAT
jgi:hypothetical protein